MMDIPNQIYELVESLQIDLNQDQQRVWARTLLIIHVGMTVIMEQKQNFVGKKNSVTMDRDAAETLLKMIEESLDYGGVKIKTVRLDTSASNECEAN